MTKKLSMQEFN